MPPTRTPTTIDLRLLENVVQRRTGEFTVVRPTQAHKAFHEGNIAHLVQSQLWSTGFAQGPEEAFELSEAQIAALMSAIDATLRDRLALSQVVGAVALHSRHLTEQSDRHSIQLRDHEGRLELIERCLAADGVGGQRAMALKTKDVAQYSEAIVTAFKNAFGVVGVILVTASEREDFALTVEIVTSSADHETTSSARKEGARARFYEALIDLLPQDVFDAIDFRFRFPK